MVRLSVESKDPGYHLALQLFDYILSWFFFVQIEDCEYRGALRVYEVQQNSPCGSHTDFTTDTI